MHIERKVSKLKPKKCCVCKELFMPYNSLQKTCGPDCAIKSVRLVALGIERKKLRQDKLKIKTRSDWMREAQAAFNAYIRERDSDLPCISCERFHEGQWHAGHYRTTKASPATRFDEDNVWRQCSACNNHLSGNIANYRIGLLQKIGADRLARLEGPHEPKKYTIEDLIAIKKEYQLKTKLLRKQNESVYP